MERLDRPPLAHEPEVKYLTWVVPDLSYLPGSKAPVYYPMEVPANLDHETEYSAFNGCKGRVQIQVGDRLEHKTVSFVQWMQRKGGIIVKPRTSLPELQ